MDAKENNESKVEAVVEPDFFADMQPVIETSTAISIDELSNKFAVQQDWNDVDDEAWSWRIFKL